MAESVRRRVQNIVASGSLKRWQKPPESSDDELDPAEIDAAEKDLDALLGRPTKTTEDEWRELERQHPVQRRMTG